jgi:hypothetical protein
MDTRLKSFSEVSLNILIGFTINLIGNAIILPFYGLPFNLLVFLEIGFWYTLISVARQYLFRRLFEHFGPKENLYTLTVRFIKWLR